MSTRETAAYIFEQLDEEQLEGFIAMFGKFFPMKQEDNSKRESFEALKGMIKSVPDLDYKKELEEYRNEKYGL